MAVQAVFFDLFETLVSEFDVAYPSSADAAMELGLDVGAVQREYRLLQQERYTGRFNDFGSVLRHIADILGAEPSDRTIAGICERREAAFAEHLRQVEPEVLDMLSVLKQMGIKLGAISNTEGSEVAGWGRSLLSGFFEAVAFSHEVGAAKPDVRIYEVACDRLSVVAAECVFVGDGNSDELAGAARAGMKPYCAAWFLRRHTSLLGGDVIDRRARGFPVLLEPRDVVEEVRAGVDSGR